MRTILIVEDNIEISDMMRSYLLKAGHSVIQAFDGEQAVKMFKAMKPDLVLLDIMLQYLDGYAICEIIRKTANIPIIVVSAKVGEEDKIKMFELGADDYLTKPFSFKEMVMRVNAQLRRYFVLNKNAAGDVRTHGNLTISPEHFEAKVGDNALHLSQKEFKLLDLLTYNANKIYSKQQLMDEVWGIDEFIDENTVAVTIARLRDKLIKVGVNNIVTIWGMGYKWQE